MILIQVDLSLADELNRTQPWNSSCNTALVRWIQVQPPTFQGKEAKADGTIIDPSMRPIAICYKLANYG